MTKLNASVRNLSDLLHAHYTQYMIDKDRHTLYMLNTTLGIIVYTYAPNSHLILLKAKNCRPFHYGVTHLYELKCLTTSCI